jgi:hypothetical protein
MILLQIIFSIVVNALLVCKKYWIAPLQSLNVLPTTLFLLLKKKDNFLQIPDQGSDSNLTRSKLKRIYCVPHQASSLKRLEWQWISELPSAITSELPLKLQYIWQTDNVSHPCPSHPPGSCVNRPSLHLPAPLLTTAHSSDVLPPRNGSFQPRTQIQCANYTWVSAKVTGAACTSVGCCFLTPMPPPQ